MEIISCYLSSDTLPIHMGRVGLKLGRPIRYIDCNRNRNTYNRDTFRCSDNIDALMFCWGGSDYGSNFKN